MTTYQQELGSQERILRVLTALIELPIDDWHTADIAAHAGVSRAGASSDLHVLAEHRFVRPTADGWCPAHRFLGIAAKISRLAA